MLDLKKDVKFIASLLIIEGIIAICIVMIGDSNLFLVINGFSNPEIDFFCVYGAPSLFILYLIFSIIQACTDRKYGVWRIRACGFNTIISGPAAYLFGRLLKEIFRRPRPYAVLPARVIGPWHASLYSFPSTTTMLAFGFALPIFLKNFKVGTPLMLLASLIGFSVIYTGFHYPGDVLAGTFLSTLLVTFINKCPLSFHRKR